MDGVNDPIKEPTPTKDKTSASEGNVLEEFRAENTTNKVRLYALLFILLLACLGAVYYFLYLPPLENPEQSFVETQAIDSQKLVELLTEYSSSTAFYFGVYEASVLNHNERNTAGLIYDLLPQTFSIYRYDTASKKLWLVKERLENKLFFDYDLVPRTAVSHDGAKMIFADRHFILFEPRTGSNRHFFPEGTASFDADTGYSYDVEFQLGSPIFSPDDTKIAYTIAFFDREERAMSVQIRTQDIETGVEEVLLDEAGQLEVGPMDNQVLPLPLVWTEDDKMLVEVRNLNQNGSPYTVSGLYAYDFETKQLREAIFNYGDGQKIAACPPGSFYYCSSAPQFISRSPGGRYLLYERDQFFEDENNVEWLIDGYVEKKQYTLLDLYTEGETTNQVAATTLGACEMNPVWSPTGEEVMCTSFFGKNSFFDAPVEAFIESSTYNIPVTYAVIDAETGQVNATFNEEVEFTPDQEFLTGLEHTLHEYDAYLDAEELTEEEIDLVKKEVQQQAAVQTFFEVLNSKKGVPEAWINTGVMTLKYSGEYTFDEWTKPSGYEVQFTNDMEDYREVMLENHESITDPAEVLMHLLQQNVYPEKIAEIKIEIESGKKYTIERGFEVVPLGEVELIIENGE